MDRNVITVADAARVRLAARRVAANRASVNLTEPVAEPAASRQPELLNGGLGTDVKPDAWFQRLAKYVPSEAVGLYLALAGLVTNDEAASPNGVIWLALMLALCIVFNSLFLKFLWKVHRWSQIVVSDVALLAYAFATGGALIQKLPFYDPRLGTVVLIVITTFLVFFSPPGDQRSAASVDIRDGELRVSRTRHVLANS